MSQPLLRVAPPDSLPVAAPLETESPLVVGPDVAPAIHPARSKLAPAPGPPARALRPAFEKGEDRDCFSNSARISGSTGIMSVAELEIYVYVVRTILQKFRHAERHCECKHSEQNHRILEQAEGRD